MTREGYLKHKALIEAWANGAELEFKAHDGKWVVLFTPTFETIYEYRIKPVTLEAWLVVFDTGALYSTYLSKEQAEMALRNSSLSTRLRVVHMKEVVSEAGH